MKLSKERQIKIENELDHAYEMLNLMFLFNGYKVSRNTADVNPEYAYYYDQMRIKVISLLNKVKDGSFNLNYTFDKRKITDMFDTEEFISYYRNVNKYGINNIKDLIDNYTCSDSYKAKFVLDGESFLSLLMLNIDEFGNNKDVIKLLNLNLNYKIESFGKEDQFFQRLTTGINHMERYGENGLTTTHKYEIMLNFLKSKIISDANKIKLINFMTKDNSKNINHFLINYVFDSEWFKSSTLKDNDYTQALVYAISDNGEIANYILNNLNYNPLATVKGPDVNKPLIEYCLATSDKQDTILKIAHNPNFNFNYFDQYGIRIYHSIFFKLIKNCNYDGAIEWLNTDKARFDIDIVKDANVILWQESRNTSVPDEYSKIVNKLYEAFMSLTLQSVKEEDRGPILIEIERLLDKCDPIREQMLKKQEDAKKLENKKTTIKDMKQIVDILSFVLNQYKAPKVYEIVRKKN